MMNEKMMPKPFRIIPMEFDEGFRVTLDTISRVECGRVVPLHSLTDSSPMSRIGIKLRGVFGAPFRSMPPWMRVELARHFCGENAYKADMIDLSEMFANRANHYYSQKTRARYCYGLVSNPGYLKEVMGDDIDKSFLEDFNDCMTILFLRDVNDLIVPGLPKHDRKMMSQALELLTNKDKQVPDTIATKTLTQTLDSVVNMKSDNESNLASLTCPPSGRYVINALHKCGEC
jgi:hypothetical protein